MNHRRGVALVLVLTVVLALTLIGTPFVLSMVMQERTASAYKDGREARYGTEGVRNFAVAWMIPGNDFSERRFGNPFGSPFHDDEREFTPLTKDGRLRKQITVTDPKGVIWGLTVQDEQGKLDLRSAPRATVDRVSEFTDPRIVTPRNYTTIYADRDARWVFPQRIRAIGQAGASALNVDDASHYGPNMKIRITKPGTAAVETTVSQNLLTNNPPVNAIVPAQGVSSDYDGGIVEVEFRHPVNVNTAPLNVLFAVMEGLSIVTQSGTAIVSADSAQAAARALKSQPVTRRTDLLLRIGGLGIPDEEKAAILLNAFDPGNIALAGTGTVPFTLVSPGTATIEAFSSVNNPSGVQTAGRGFREVVRMAPPARIDRRWECQTDFDVWYQWGALQSQGLYGYPFGNRIMTFPNVPPQESDTTLRPQQQSGGEAWVQLAPSRDHRGTSQFLNSREHYDSTPEGLEVQNSTVPWDWTQAFYRMANIQMPDVTAGGTEFWIRFRVVNDPMSIFDIRQSDYENRVSLRYEQGELIFSAADATLRDPNDPGLDRSTDPLGVGLAEIRYPFTPQPDTWYHIGAYWKGTRYAHLALLVDGFCEPGATFTHVNDDDEVILTELSSALTADRMDTTINLAENGFIPAGWVPLQVGQEVILYEKSSGNGIRAGRGTTEAVHPAGAKVQVFGYASKIRNASVRFTGSGVSCTYDRICTGGAKLHYGFGINPATRVDGESPAVPGISPTATRITTLGGDISQFPQQGYITIDDEAIFYTSFDVEPPAFTGCKRGQAGTAAAQHAKRARIRLWSVAANSYGSPAADDMYLSPTILQVDSEWIGPLQKDPQRNGFWTGMMQGGSPVRMQRSVLGSRRQAHADGAKIRPTFVVRESDSRIARPKLNCGSWDRVTLINADNTKTRMTIFRAADIGDPRGSIVANTGIGTQLASFMEDAPRVHYADDEFVRMLKFPSGELLCGNWCAQTGPQFVFGTFDATMDEVKFYASPKGDFQLATELPDSGGTTAGMNGASGMSQTGGAIKVGDEIIGYSRIAGNTLDPITRGYLSSPEHVHDAGDYAFNMSFLPITSLQQDIGTGDAAVTLNAQLQGDGKYRTGYALIGSEVIGFESGGNTLWMPSTFDGARGLFRGRFGTVPSSHKTDDLAYGIPFRYWDTYQPQEFDNRMCYWQVSAGIPDAAWGRVSWESKTVADDPNVLLHVLVRVDGMNEFYDPPNGQSKFLREFTRPKAANDLNLVGYINQPGQLDIRFYVEYAQSSYWPNDSWKRTPRLYEVRIEYERATKILYHEDQ
ncbi:MAG: PilX N-terminal domain-containing pilus assembly protein [Planctomycetota bacterium]|jgi:hypothetical protein